MSVVARRRGNKGILAFRIKWYGLVFTRGASANLAAPAVVWLALWAHIHQISAAEPLDIARDRLLGLRACASGPLNPASTRGGMILGVLPQGWKCFKSWQGYMRLLGVLRAQS